MPNASSLNGMRILNTRAKHQARPLSNAITNAGGIAIELPLLCISPTDPQWQEALPELIHIDFAIFISPNAVHAFFKHTSPASWPTTIKTFTLGQGTANALNTYGIISLTFPKQADSEHLLMLMRHETSIEKGENCLIIKGVGGRRHLQNKLVQQGINVHTLDVYQRTLPTPNHTYVTSLWHQDAVDIILITSKTALDYLFIVFGENAWPWLCHKPCLVISERLSQAAHDKGIKNIIISPYENIITTLIHNKDAHLL